MIHIDLPARKTLFASSTYWRSSHKLATVRVTRLLIADIFAALLPLLHHVFNHVIITAKADSRLSEGLRHDNKCLLFDNFSIQGLLSDSKISYNEDERNMIDR